MQVFNIRDIENLIGIKAHTIRIWEKRYQLMTPTRSSGNQRVYDNDDLKFLLRISSLYHRGYKISTIAKHSTEELDRLILESQVLDASYETYINQLLESAMDFDPIRFERVVNACLEQFGFERSIQFILFPLLIKIGLLWLTSHVIPAQEHFASNILMKKISAAIEEIGSKTIHPDFHVVLFTPQKEFHELPILMMHYLLKKRGIRSTYFGSDVSISSLSDFCERNKVTHLYTHILTHLQRQEPDEFAAEMSSAFPQQEIVLSGPAMHHLKRDFVNVHLIRGEMYFQSFLHYLQKSHIEN
jgi:DNA-binding transcriptional MerR regulator